MAFFRNGENAKKPIYLNTAYSFKERAADLVSGMNLEEKQSQLGKTMPPIPRLGVNKYDVWGEALPGIMGRIGHHYTQSNEEATASGLKSGVETDCGSVYQTISLSALEKGLITEADMDKALINILNQKILFINLFNFKTVILFVNFL